MEQKIPTTFRRRMIWCNLLIIICIATSISLYSYLSYRDDVIQRETADSVNRLQALSARLTVACDEMINLVQNCAGRKSLFLTSTYRRETGESMEQRSIYAANVLRDFCAISGYSQYIYKITVYNKGYPLLQAGTSAGSYDDVSCIQQASWFPKLLNKNQRQYALTLEENPFTLGQASDPAILPLVRPLQYSRQDKPEDAWVFLAISPKLFRDALATLPSDCHLNILAADKTVVSSTPSASIDSSLVVPLLLADPGIEGRIRTNLEDTDCVITWQKLPVSGLLLYEVQPVREMPLDHNVVKRTIFFVFICCMAIGFLLSLLFTRYLTAPIQRLIGHLNQIASGDFTRASAIESHDEIGIIGRQINDMSSHISDLMDNRIQVEKEKKDLEIKMLQAQINPHFLYNTLDSIKWIATMQHNSGIVKVVTALSALLKNMAKGFHEKVTLQQELDFLDHYVTIEKIRYIELFDIVIQVDDPLLYHANIIKLTLQPIVENAIFSGIEPSGRPGLIQIHVFSRTNVLYITITDNGVGISDDTIQKLLTDTDRVSKNYMSGIGLPNVDRRLKMVYGDEYGLSILSELLSYTTVTISLPLEYQTDQELETKMKGD